MQSALQDEIATLRSQYRSERDPAGLVFASLADAYRRAGELDEAWSLLDEGLDQHPEFTTGHLVAARVLRDRGDAAGAAQRYGRVLDLDPENTSALREKAALAQDEGRIEEALSLCQRLALLEPTDPDLRARIRTLKESHFRAAREVSADVDDGVDPEEVGGAGAVEVAAEAEELDELQEVEDVEEAAPEAEARDDVGMEDAPAEETEAPDEEEAWVAEESEPAVFTRTMADLYARQGHAERALRIYRRLLERDPENEILRNRIRDLEEEGTAPTGDGPSISTYFESLIGWEGRT